MVKIGSAHDEASVMDRATSWCIRSTTVASIAARTASRDERTARATATGVSRERDSSTSMRYVPTRPDAVDASNVAFPSVPMCSSSLVVVVVAAASPALLRRCSTELRYDRSAAS